MRALGWMLVGMMGVACAFGFWLLRQRQAEPALPPAVHVTVAPLPGEVPAPKPVDATRSVVALNCGDQRGAGFFIGPDQLITNAHVLCGGKLPLIVALRDGRKLLGTVSAKDDWADLARIDVPGADAEPLVIGDTTALQPGDPVTFIGSPKGLDFTTHDGRVSFVGRNYLGVAYVQLNAAVNPGNSGGPLLDAQGRVLGIVSMKVQGSDGIGLALPIEYARAPVEGPSLERWLATRARVAEEDLQEQKEEALRLAPGRPKLVAVQRVEGHGLAAVVALRWGQAPHALLHDFTLEPQGCLVRANTAGWVPLAEAMEKAQDPRRFAWLLKHKLAEGVSVGAGVLEPIDCPEAKLTGLAQLVLRGAPETLTIDAADLRVPLVKKQEAAAQLTADAHAQAQQDAQREAADEARWRARYTQARARIAKALAVAAEAQRQVDAADEMALNRRGVLSPQGRLQYDRWKEAIVRAAQEKTAAEADLHELDRQAANEAVPLEWRR